MNKTLILSILALVASQAFAQTGTYPNTRPTPAPTSPAGAAEGSYGTSGSMGTSSRVGVSGDVDAGASGLGVGIGSGVEVQTGISAGGQIDMTPPNPISDEERFARLDSDRDGAISKAEASANAELSYRFRNLDRNHNSKLSREEFNLRNRDISSR